MIEELLPSEKAVCRVIIEQKLFRKQQIADYMNRKIRTVQSHIHHIFEKLDIHSMAELVDWLHEHKELLNADDI